MNIFIDSVSFFVVLNTGQTLPICWLILWKKIFDPLVCTVWHTCFRHGYHVENLWNILMKKRNISILCQSDYLTNILAKYFLKIYGACSTNYLLTNAFTQTKLHQYVGLILINSLENMLSPFLSLWTQDFTTDFCWDTFPNDWFWVN